MSALATVPRPPAPPRSRPGTAFSPSRYDQEYEPVLTAESVIHVDTTDLDSLDIPVIAKQILDLVETTHAGL